VVPLPGAAEQPVKVRKVVIEATGTGTGPTQPLPGLVWAATLLNRAGASGLKASHVEILVVLHGEALDDATYKVFGHDSRHAELTRKLKAQGEGPRVPAGVGAEDLQRMARFRRSVENDVVLTRRLTFSATTRSSVGSHDERPIG
jgi:hypothetical protein